MKPIFLKCLPLLRVALATTPAWAGSWTVGLDFDGKCVSGSATRPWAYDDENDIYQSAWTYSSNFSGSSSGKFILVLGWRASSPGEKISPSVTVRVQQTVQGSGGRKDMSAFPSPYNPAPGTPGSVTLSTRVATPDGATFPDSTHERKLDDGYNSYSSLSQNPPALVVVSTQGAVAQQGGSFLVRYPLPSIKGSFDVTPGTYTIETEPHNFDTYSDGCWAMVTASVAFALDNREVYLTRGSLVPKIEGAPGVTIDKAHDEWREADGTGHGHTTYSYNWVGIGEQFNFQNFQASRGGTWTWKTNPQGTGNIPNVSWSWDPVGSDPADTDLSSRQMMRFGSPNKVGQEWQGTPTGTDTRTITYSATDKGDGTKGTAKYNLTLHDEWDAATDDTPSETHETRSIDLNVARIDGPQKDETWTFSKITAGLTAELKTTFGADFKLSDWLNAGGSFETTAKLEIESSYEAKSPLLQLAAGESAVPCVNYIVKTRHKLFDHWTASGWDKDNARADGKWPQDADLPVPIGDISANWHKLTTGKPLP